MLYVNGPWTRKLTNVITDRPQQAGGCGAARRGLPSMRMKIGSQSGLRGARVFAMPATLLGVAPAIRQAFGVAMLRDRREAEWLGASIQNGLSGRLS